MIVVLNLRSHKKFSQLSCSSPLTLVTNHCTSFDFPFEFHPVIKNVSDGFLLPPMEIFHEPENMYLSRLFNGFLKLWDKFLVGFIRQLDAELEPNNPTITLI